MNVLIGERDLSCKVLLVVDKTRKTLHKYLVHTFDLGGALKQVTRLVKIIIQRALWLCRKKQPDNVFRLMRLI